MSKLDQLIDETHCMCCLMAYQELQPCFFSQSIPDINHHQSFTIVQNMKLSLLLVLGYLGLAQAQFGFFRDFGRFITRPFRPTFRDDGTRSPQATGNDEINPSDCGRNTDTGTGKLCFPDGLLCQNSKLEIILGLLNSARNLADFKMDLHLCS